MANFEGLVVRSGVAAADLSANQYRIVRHTSSGLALATADNQVFAGVLQDKPAAAGRAASYAVAGVTPCVAGGTIAVGDLITSDSQGRGVKATALLINTTSGAIQAGSNIIGRARTAASAAGELFELEIDMSFLPR